MAWDPAQYEKFRAERMAPFFDAAALIDEDIARSAARVIDLGCGTGELTAMLAERLPLAAVEGVDNSEEMLARARPREHDRLHFTLGDAAAVDVSPYDIVFSHAALHWVPDHETFFPRLLAALRPGAALVVQMPRNEAHPSHRIARALAREAPYRDWLRGFEPRSHALTIERYAELMYEGGLHRITCLEKIYGHELGHTSDVVEWTRGTLLVPYLDRLAAPQQSDFLTAYRARLLTELGDRSPYYFPFRRLLLKGVRPPHLTLRVRPSHLRPAADT